MLHTEKTVKPTIRAVLKLWSLITLPECFVHCSLFINKKEEKGSCHVISNNNESRYFAKQELRPNPFYHNLMKTDWTSFLCVHCVFVLFVCFFFHYLGQCDLICYFFFSWEWWWWGDKAKDWMITIIENNKNFVDLKEAPQSFSSFCSENTPSSSSYVFPNHDFILHFIFCASGLAPTESKRAFLCPAVMTVESCQENLPCVFVFVCVCLSVCEHPVNLATQALKLHFRRRRRSHGTETRLYFPHTSCMRR